MSGRSDRTDEREVYRIATANRLLAADMFARLTPEEWTTPSLCAGWTVREVAAHLLSPLESEFSWPQVLRTVLRYRGDLSRFVDEQTRLAAARPTEELVAGLRSRAGTRLKVPVTGRLGPMTDTAIHLRDAARPLGLADGPPPEDWRPALDFLVSRTATAGFLPRGRLRGLRLVATDQDWSAGDGAELRGPSEAVAMAVSGRAVALPDLSGPGVALLASRLGREVDRTS